MSFKILNINRDLLKQLEPLLIVSAGYQTSMTDEIDYFDSQKPKNWFLATNDAESPIGLIRSFNQGVWSQVELFVSIGSDRGSIVEGLIKSFIDNSIFESGHRLRFDVVKSDAEVVSCIKRLDSNLMSQTFFCYELSLPEKTTKSDVQILDVAASEVAESFANLHPVDLEEVELWI